MACQEKILRSKNFKQKLRHQVVEAEAVKAEALRAEAEAIKKCRFHILGWHTSLRFRCYKSVIKTSNFETLNDDFV